MTKRVSLSVSLLLLLSLLLSLCPPAFAADDDAIHIRTAEDLIRLARDCSLDTWSDGKSVVLDNDLSLSGSGFDSIPIFNGSFDGQGHTIYDMNLSSAQSPCGFFLETGKDADIHDLHVSGSVYTRGDDSMVGGLVGLNRGMLTNCSFSGEVRALTQVGGVAGKNDVSGMIVSCSASGTVQGLTQTGGIAGENAGALSVPNCGRSKPGCACCATAPGSRIGAGASGGKTACPLSRSSCCRISRSVPTASTSNTPKPASARTTNCRTVGASTMRQRSPRRNVWRTRAAFCRN